MRIHVYWKDNGKKADAVYTDAVAIKAGKAEDVLGREDAEGNGIPYNARLIQIVLADNGTATFDADKVEILLG